MQTHSAPAASHVCQTARRASALIDNLITGDTVDPAAFYTLSEKRHNNATFRPCVRAHYVYVLGIMNKPSAVCDNVFIACLCPHTPSSGSELTD